MLWSKLPGDFAGYMDGLAVTFDPESAPDLVCRYLVSMDYDGRLYDCDFNRIKGVPVQAGDPMTVFNFDLRALI